MNAQEHRGGVVDESDANGDGANGELRVTFAPDFRELGPYQELLARALGREEVHVTHLPGYRRVLPMVRSLQSLPMDVLHMHYPSHYFLQYKRGDLLRKLRFPFDLRMATGRMPMVYTVHDLYPLDHPAGFLTRMDSHYALRRAAALIVHSETAKKRIAAVAPELEEKCVVIPHGDLSPTYGTLLPQAEARAKLGLGGGKLCLVFGIITPNKGAEALIAFWKRAQPGATLAIVGRPKFQSYARALKAQAGDASGIHLRFAFQSDEEVRLWFSAADCVIINYETIFTSGVASLARSYGLSVLLPSRSETVDLQEPHPSVFRFDSVEGNFGEKLHGALLFQSSYATAEEWRKSIAWDRIAADTRRVYDRAIATGK